MPYLAMTPAEFNSVSQPPPDFAYMACHFSPYGTGLGNLPTVLPPESLLILNDRTPIHGHDPQRIFDQLKDVLAYFSCRGLLLDLQQESGEALPLIQKLLTLPCPVIVSALFAEQLDCPIFLPPVPLLISVEDYLTPYHGREIWLETALDGLQLTLTTDGCHSFPLPMPSDDPMPHRDTELCCHYRVETTAQAAIFTLRRTKKDLDTLIQRANALGIAGTVGLYQELGF